MRYQLWLKQLEATRLGRLDVAVFGAAFLAGLVFYVSLHVLLRLPQIVVTTMIILTMVGYAGVVVYTPRLHLRLDQAGDNAYYLGLLFTLVSMAFALYGFGSVVASGGPQEGDRSGAQYIIANFGIALASTIAGILLRVVLHQMRVDPADVETMTRIELSEASKRIRAALDTVSVDIAVFHDEVRQRSVDALEMVMDESQMTVGRLREAIEGATTIIVSSTTDAQRRMADAMAAVTHVAGESAGALTQRVERTTRELLDAAASAQRSVIDEAGQHTRQLGELVDEVRASTERLRAIEAPPLVLSRRLDRVGKLLDTIASQTERLSIGLQEAADGGAAAGTALSTSATALEGVARDVARQQNDVADRVQATVMGVTAALASVGEELQRELRVVADLEAAARRVTEEGVRAEAAAVEVLARLSELARGLTEVLEARARTDRV